MTDWLARSIAITHDVGLHARPAVKLTKLAKAFTARIELAASDQGPWIDAKSIVKVMAMKAKKNAVLHVRASGSDAAEALQSLIGLVERDFDESRTDAVAS